MCSFYNIPLYFYGSKEELGRFTGKEFRVSVGILDDGFKNSMVKLLKLNSSEM